MQELIEFPARLWEKYEPKRVRDFIGIEGPRRIAISLINRPRPDSFIFHGPTGCGKSTLGMAMCREMGASLVHIPAQQCDVARIDQLALDLQYVPPQGGLWFVLIDEADEMTDKAQLQLLSRMDGTAKLQATWGHAFMVGKVPPIFWLMTCNSMANFEPRFVGRCKPIDFDPVPTVLVAKYIRKVWGQERGRPGLPLEFFTSLAEGADVRNALNRLELELLRNPTIREVKAALALKEEKRLSLEKAEISQWAGAAKSIAELEQVVG